MARQVFLELDSVREYQTRWINAAACSFPAEVCLRRNTASKQPERTSIDASQQTHPDVEYRWCNLVVAVEASEHETLVRQSRLPPGGCLRPYHSLRIVDLVTFRQVHDVFGVEFLLIEWQDDWIGDHIIVKIGAQRPRKSDVAHLNWGWPIGKDFWATIVRIAALVDDDIHLHIIQKHCNVAIAFRSDIVKLVEGADQPGPYVAAVVRPERNPQDFEPGTVVELEQLHHQISSGMVMETARYIGDAYLIIAPNLSFPQSWQTHFADEGLSACQLQCGIATVPKTVKRVDCRVSLGHACSHLVGKLGRSRPVARGERATRQRSERGLIVGRYRKRLLEARRRLVEARESCQCIAASDERLDMVGPQRERFFVLCERFFIPVERAQPITEIDACMNIVRPDRERGFAVRDPLFVAAEGPKRAAE